MVMGHFSFPAESHTLVYVGSIPTPATSMRGSVKSARRALNPKESGRSWPSQPF